MLKVITCNVNGIRSAARKGFFNWLAKQDADVVCLQEIKAKKDQLDDPLFYPKPYYHYYVEAEKKGYSGVALFCKQKPSAVRYGLGFPSADSEGRYIEVDFGNLSISSLYLPSGTMGELRQTVKFDFLKRYQIILAKAMEDKSRDYIVCGDLNIAHTTLDLKNWKNNQNTSGFLPEERAWLDHVFGTIGFVDAFRYRYPNKEQYTWWSPRAGSWERNVGWRIDYQIITPKLAPTVSECTVYRDEKFSDHAPLIVSYNLSVAAPL